jgi:hypothetical protein
MAGGVAKAVRFRQNATKFDLCLTVFRQQHHNPKVCPPTLAPTVQRQPTENTTIKTLSKYTHSGSKRLFVFCEDCTTRAQLLCLPHREELNRTKLTEFSGLAPMREPSNQAR